MRRHKWICILAGLLAAAGPAMAAGCVETGRENTKAVNRDSQDIVDESTHIIVQALSRGAGVPRAAKKALQDIEKQVAQWQQQGSVLSFEKTVIGIEGERQLCIHFANTQVATEALASLLLQYSSVDLLNLRRGECGRSGK